MTQTESKHKFSLVSKSLVGLFSLTLIAGFQPMATAEDADSETNQPGFDVRAAIDLRSCLSQKGSVLDVYYLIDNSKSMNSIGGKVGTDPNGLRFEAVQNSLAPLIDLASNQDSVVNVAGGLFSKGGETLVRWTEINPDSEDQFASFSEDLSREAGGGTNWVEGLKEAQKQLLAQKGTPGKHCQMLVWLTDGGIDIEQDTVKTSAGIEELCGLAPTRIGTSAQEKGLMFDIRKSGIVLQGVIVEQAPGTGEELGQNPQKIRDSKVSYFDSVVYGSGQVDAYYFNNETPLTGVFNCGQTVPGAQGQVLRIKDAGELKDTFQELVTCITESCTQLPPASVVCDGETCSIAVPKGIASMQISVPSEFNADSITAPNGSGACLPEACSSEKEIKNSGTVRILVNNQAGVWTIATAEKSLNPLLFSELEITADPIEIDPFAREISVEIGLSQGVKVAYSQENYESLQFNATVRFATGESEPAKIASSTDGWQLTWSPSAKTPEGITPKDVVISLAATAGGEGSAIPPLKLAGIEQVFLVIQKNLESYPSIVNPIEGGTLLFSPIEGNAGVGKAEITVRGPKSNAGAVCWDDDADGLVGAYIDSQSQVSRDISAALDSSSLEVITCPSGQQGIAVPQNAEIVIPIDLMSTDQADGLLTGTIELSLYGPEGEPGFPRFIEFQAETTVVKSGIAFWIVLSILTLLGVGVPYAALILFARRQAAFSAQLNGTRWALLPATVGPEGLLSLGEKNDSDYEFIFVEKKGVTRSIETGGERHEVIPPALWPFKPARTVVKAAEGSSIFTNHDGSLDAGRSIGESSQALGNVFYFVADAKTETAQIREVGRDDWGNAQDVVAVEVPTETGMPISGKVVLLAPGNINPGEAISKAKADVRTWFGWANVYSAMTTGESSANVEEATPKSKKSKGKGNLTAPETVTTGSAIEDEWGFGPATTGSDRRSTDKKTRFGRSSKKSGDGDSKRRPPPDFDFNSSDW